MPRVPVGLARSCVRDFCRIQAMWRALVQDALRQILPTDNRPTHVESPLLQTRTTQTGQRKLLTKILAPSSIVAEGRICPYPQSQRFGIFIP